jgi:hypothetical protein
MKCLVALVALLAMRVAAAAELTAIIHGESVGIVLSQLPLPDNLPKELKSGLNNRMLIQVELTVDGKPLLRRAVEVTVKYDLWDENFVQTVIVDGIAGPAIIHRDVAEPLHFLANPRLTSLFPMQQLPDGELRLQASVLLNPIDRERLEQIRRWVAQNSTFAATDGAGPARPSNAPVTSVIFNRIFEQFAAGSELASAWKQSVSSRPFQRRDLRK